MWFNLRPIVSFSRWSFLFSRHNRLFPVLTIRQIGFVHVLYCLVYGCGGNNVMLMRIPVATLLLILIQSLCFASFFTSHLHRAVELSVVLINYRLILSVIRRASIYFV